MKDLIKNLQLGLLVVILISTVIAVFLEISNMYQLKEITLADLLLMFLYLEVLACLLYTSPSPRDRQKSRMPSSA